MKNQAPAAARARFLKNRHSKLTWIFGSILVVLVPKCGQVNTKMESKIDVNLKWRFLKNRALAAAGARFFIIGASKLRRKIDRKSITKPSTRWNAPWHRLSFDFGRFRSASSGGKTIQNRCRKTSKIVMLLARGRVRPGSKGVFPLPSSGNTLKPSIIVGGATPRTLRLLSRS